jgi:hypothetical protein
MGLILKLKGLYFIFLSFIYQVLLHWMNENEKKKNCEKLKLNKRETIRNGNERIMILALPIFLNLLYVNVIGVKRVFFFSA